MNRWHKQIIGRWQRGILAVCMLVLGVMMPASYALAQDRLTDGLLETLDGVEAPSKMTDQEPASLDALLHESVHRLMRGDVTLDTLKLQDSIVDQFDALIRSIDESQRDAAGAKAAPPSASQGKESNQKGGTKANQPPTPARQLQNESSPSSGVENGTGDEKTAAEVDKLLKQVQLGPIQELQRRVWGHLPDKVRRKMEAAASDRFLPSYQRSIEEYYRRLNRERTTP